MLALNTPRQFGPSRRMPWLLATAVMRSCSAAPASFISAKPAENMMTARHPFLPSSSTEAMAWLAGTATMPTSGAAGSADMVAKAGSPCTVGRFGFTGHNWPAKPRCFM